MTIKVTTICKVDIRLTVLDSRITTPIFHWHQSIYGAIEDGMQRLANAATAGIPMTVLCEMFWNEKGEAKNFTFFHGICEAEG